MPKIHVEKLAGWQCLWSQVWGYSCRRILEDSWHTKLGSLRTWDIISTVGWFLKNNPRLFSIHICMYVHVHLFISVYNYTCACTCTHMQRKLYIPIKLSFLPFLITWIQFLPPFFFQFEELRLVFILVQIYWDSFSQILIIWSFPPAR